MRFVERTDPESPVLRALIDWYLALPADGGWPARSAFRAETLPPRVLPYIGRVDVEPEPFRIFYRAAGGRLCDSVGVELTGRYLDEVDVPHAEGVTEWYRLAVAAPGPLYVRGEQTVDRHTFTYEGCCLPLGSAGETPRAFVIGEDILDADAWSEAIRRRRYDTPT
jgi:hypothetical protein